MKKIITLAMSVWLFGCAAAQTSMVKKDLDVQTKTSTSIFVDAVAAPKRTIFLDIRSGVQEFDRNAFRQFVSQQFTSNANGYRLVDNPETAQFTMVAYVVNLEKASPTAAQAALGQGFLGDSTANSAVAGAAIGSSVSSRGDSGKGALQGAVAFAAIDFVAGNLVKDVTYMLVVDVQIKERAAPGAIVRKDTAIKTKVSDDGKAMQTVSEVSNQKEYRTRIVTTANKVNLKLEEAQPKMFDKTAYALSGFF
ncbi:MAG: hypothetical protein RL497_1030 [Pseudomonadota bacterium]|jgi:hypothetical protein